MHRLDSSARSETERTTRRNVLLGVTTAVALAGCAGGNGDHGAADGDDAADETGGIEGWEVTEREAEAWDDLTAGMDVVASFDEYENADVSGEIENEVVDARERLAAANEVYDDLSGDASGNLSGNLFINVRNFFSELAELAATASDLLGIALGEDVGASVDRVISLLNGHIEDATGLWEGTEELRDGLVDRSFPATID